MPAPKIRLVDEMALDFRSAVHRGACLCCGDRLAWRATFHHADDFPRYSARCCDLVFHLTPSVVAVLIEAESDAKQRPTDSATTSPE